jgi:hypothetical protein
MPGQGAERRYKDLRKEFAKWLPKWMAHFGVQSSIKIGVQYVNLINRQTVPSFVDKQGSISLDRVITVFARIPGEHECVIPPFNCKATVQLQGRANAYMQIEMNSWASPQFVPGVVVNFSIDADPLDDGCSAESILGLMDWCHQRIIDRFEVVFTEEAKMTFKPEIE